MKNNKTKHESWAGPPFHSSTLTKRSCVRLTKPCLDMTPFVCWFALLVPLFGLVCVFVFGSVLSVMAASSMLTILQFWSSMSLSRQQNTATGSVTPALPALEKKIMWWLDKKNVMFPKDLFYFFGLHPRAARNHSWNCQAEIQVKDSWTESIHCTLEFHGVKLPLLQTKITPVHATNWCKKMWWWMFVVVFFAM